MVTTPKIARGGLLNVETSERQEFLFNPKQFTVAVAVEWAKTASLGGSSQRLHYGHTGNLSVSFELEVNRHVLFADAFEGFGGGSSEEARRETDNAKLQVDQLLPEYRNFLLSLAYPRGRQSDPIRRSPPPVVFFWPKICEIPVRLAREDFQFEKFVPRGGELSWKCPVTFELDTSERLTSDMIRRRGLMLAGQRVS